MASSSPSGSCDASDLPWVEKYRPVNFKDIVGNEDSVSKLQDIARNASDMPNLILYGPPGTGKTTSILALAHELFGSDYREFVLELDASDGRGIDVVINEITMFAQKNVGLSPGRFKIIILDKVDRVAAVEQEALSRTMKVHSKSARFALTCFISTDIIEPIQSRCTLVMFSRLSYREVECSLKEAIFEEKVAFDPEQEGLKKIIRISYGNVRRALNYLQATFSRYRFVSKENFNEIYASMSSDRMEGEFYDDCSVFGPLAGFVRGNSCWNDCAAAKRFCQTMASRQVQALVDEEFDREGPNVVFRCWYQGCVFIKEAVIDIERLKWDVARIGKERDEVNERAANLAIDNEELKCDVARIGKERDEANGRAANLAIDNEELSRMKQSMTRKWKDKFRFEKRRWKVRFLNEQSMTSKWKVRFADVKVKRRKKAKNVKRQLKLVEKEKAELQQQVAELEMLQAAKEKAELQRKVAELEMVQTTKEKAELQQKVAELESLHAAAEQLLAFKPPPLQ